MNSISLLAVTIFSGAIAGTILAIINLGLVEPYIDSAIALETQRKISIRRECGHGGIGTL